MSDLDDRLIAAHRDGDARALVRLYAEAATAAITEAARGFYLTHAYVFALETGDPSAVFLRADLIAAGREE